jgi:predicted dehydrogenase
VSAMAVAGCHAIDALRWFAAPGEFEAADPVEVFAYAGGRRKGATRQFNPLEERWHEGTIRDDRLYAPAQPGHDGWSDLPGIRPDSSDVSHHPFQAQADHFIECLQRGVESHCNLADAAKTHEVVFAALECYRTGRPGNDLRSSRDKR